LVIDIIWKIESRAHRLLIFDVAPPRIERGDFAVPRNEGDNAGDRTVVHKLLETRTDHLQPSHIEPGTGRRQSGRSCRFFSLRVIGRRIRIGCEGTQRANEVESRDLGGHTLEHIAQQALPVHGELLNCPKLWRFAVHRFGAMHMICKAQVRRLAKGDVLGQRAFNPSGFRFGPRCQLGTPPTNSLGLGRGRISLSDVLALKDVRRRCAISDFLNDAR
jgi:hypothetical protein